METLGDVAFLDKIYHWVQDLVIYSLRLLPVLSQLPIDGQKCDLPAVSSCLLPCLPHYEGLYVFGIINQGKLLLKLLLPWYFIIATEN